MTDNLSQDYYSYGYNDDDTDPTPVPHTFRPPLPSQHPETQSPNDLSLLDKTLFSFSVGGTLPEEGSLPSFPQEPPSPLSRPTPSLLEGEEDPSRLFARRTTNYNYNHNRQPPISEVHLDNSDDDTFFECVDDKSLAQRTRRSLMATPQPKNISTISYDDSNRSRGKSRTTTPSLAEMVESSVSQSSRISHSMRSAGTRSRSSSPLKQQQLDLNTTNRTTDPTSDDVVRVHESALQAIIRLKEELLRANDRNEMLKGQQQTLMEEKDELLSRFHQVHMDMEEKQHQLHSLELDRSDWQRDKRELERQLRSTVRERKDAMHRKLAADNRQKEWKGQLETLQLELEEALAAKEELASDLAVLQNTNSQLKKEKNDLTDQLDQVQADSGKIRSLRLEMETKDDEISKLKSTLADTKDEGQELRLKLETLQKEHEKSIKDMEDLQLALGRQKSTSIRFQQHEEPEAGALDSSIADRLARMRDSAERAHMIRVHKREISRLKLDKEAEIQRLVSSHEDAMRKAAKQANANLNTKLDEVKAVLRDEYEEKMEEAESHHIQKFAKMQQEFLRSQEDADEALRIALNKASAASHEYEREGFDMLNAKLEKEKQKLKEQYESQQEKLRRQWEEERDTLLAVIQKDCNLAFENHRIRSNNSGSGGGGPPRLRSNTIESGDSFKSFPTMTVNVGRLSEEVSMTKPLISPSSDIASVLNETEALIQSIM